MCVDQLVNGDDKNDECIDYRFDDDDIMIVMTIMMMMMTQLTSSSYFLTSWRRLFV